MYKICLTTWRCFTAKRGRRERGGPSSSQTTKSRTRVSLSPWTTCSPVEKFQVFSHVTRSTKSHPSSSPSWRKKNQKCRPRRIISTSSLYLERGQICMLFSVSRPLEKSSRPGLWNSQDYSPAVPWIGSPVGPKTRVSTVFVKLGND